MQFLEGGSTGPNGRAARPAEEETPEAPGGRGSLMSRYRGPGPEDQAPPPRDSAESAPPLPPAPPQDSPWRDSSSWTSPPPRPSGDRPFGERPSGDRPAADRPAPPAPKADVPPAPRTDPSRADSTRTDAPRTDPARTDAPRTDPARTDPEPKVGSPAPATAATSAPVTSPATKPAPSASAPSATAAPATGTASGTSTTASGTGTAPAPSASGPATTPGGPAKETPVTTLTAPSAPAVTVTRGTTPGRSAVPASSGLLSNDQTVEFKQRWRELQGDFVDDPQQAVRSAGDLAREVLEALAATIADSERIEGWKAGDGSSGTEDLRVALRQYRGLVDRLLEI